MVRDPVLGLLLNEATVSGPLSSTLLREAPSYRGGALLVLVLATHVVSR